MRRFNSPLDSLSVAAPCPADWDCMMGDDRVRFCGQCNLNVYNLSAMSKAEAESLIARTEGRLCVRYYRRKDGSVITEDCPVGLRALKRRASRIKRAVVSTVLGFLAGIGVNVAVNRVGSSLIDRLIPLRAYGQTTGVMAKPNGLPSAAKGQLVIVGPPARGRALKPK
ncbi:MAG: hypothetical protein ACMG6H_13680 [Acidobacteriota bacterium]